MAFNFVKSRVAISLAFFESGLCFASWTSRIPHIQRNLNLEDFELGILLFCLPIGTIFFLPFSNRLVGKFGSKFVLCLSLLLLPLVLLSISLSVNKFQLGAVLIIYGMINNATNLSLNLIGLNIEKLSNRSLMGSFHGIWSLACLLGALFTNLSITLDLSLNKQFFYVLLISGLIIIYTFKNIQDIRPEVTKTTFKLKFSFKEKGVMVFSVISFIAMACEGGLHDWGIIYLADVFSLNQNSASFGYTIFILSMTIGRFTSDFFVSKLGLAFSLRISSIFIVVGLFLSIIITHVSIAFFSFSIIGFGLSFCIPIIYSMLSVYDRNNISDNITKVSFISLTGLTVTPALIGIIAEKMSIKSSFIFLLLLSIISMLLINIFLKDTYQKLNRNN